MKTIEKLIVLLLLTGLCIAQPVPGDGEPAAHKSKAHHAAKRGHKKAQTAVSAEDVQQLKEQIRAQQAEIDQIKQQGAQHDQQTQQAFTDAQKTATAAQEKAAATETVVADTNAKVEIVKSDVADLKTTSASTAAIVQKDEKRVNDLETPVSIHYKGVKITPNGYIQLASIYRSHNANSDTSTSWGSFPLSGSANSKVNEFRESGRASRLSLKIEGAAKSMKFMGYYESDFLGSSPNASESQTSSYAPRLRLAFGNVDLPGGWSLTGGQDWSLLQTTRRGIAPLTEWLPSLIDNSYTVGFSYARQGSIRVTKAIGNKAWIAVSAENPETVSNTQCLQSVGSTSTTNATASCSIGTAVNGGQTSTLTTAPLGSSFASTATPSNDIAPDLIAKFAFEPGWGHFEVKALGRWFRDRTYPGFNTPVTTTTGTPPNTTTTTTVSASTVGGVNRVTEGGGLGFSAILPIVPRKLDVFIQGLGGKGIGRFGTTGGPDVTTRPDGSLVPIKSLQAVVGIETHPSTKLDLYVYGGDEYYGRTTYSVASGNLFGATKTPYIIGYGSSSFLDGGCRAEFPGTTAATSCMSSAQNRNVWAVQPGFWYRLFKGKEGTVQFGAFYAYTYRRTWSGVGAVAKSTTSPLAIENAVMTSFRYYLP